MNEAEYHVKSGGDKRKPTFPEKKLQAIIKSIKSTCYLKKSYDGS